MYYLLLLLLLLYYLIDRQTDTVVLIMIVKSNEELLGHNSPGPSHLPEIDTIQMGRPTARLSGMVGRDRVDTSSSPHRVCRHREVSDLQIQDPPSHRNRRHISSGIYAGREEVILPAFRDGTPKMFNSSSKEEVNPAFFPLMDIPHEIQVFFFKWSWLFEEFRSSTHCSLLLLLYRMKHHLPLQAFVVLSPRTQCSAHKRMVIPP